MMARRLLIVQLAIWLVVALCCAAQVAQAFGGRGIFSGMSSKKIREKDPAERSADEWHYLAQKGVKKLFTWSDELSVSDALDRLHDLKGYSGGDLPAHISIDDLLDFNETSENKCSGEYMGKLKKAHAAAKQRYKALYKYINDCFERQLKSCGFENIFQMEVEKFKQEEPRKWQLIVGFSNILGSSGQTEYDWDGERLDNNYMMNEAIKQLWQEFGGGWSQNDASRNSYDLVHELRNACSAYQSRITPSVINAKIDRRLKKNKEITSLLRYSDVCEQVGRANFQQAIGNMHWDQIHPRANELWDQYRLWSEYS